MDKVNLRIRRDAEKEKKVTESDTEEEYDLENEDSDKPKIDLVDHAAELQNDVKKLNYDIK